MRKKEQPPLLNYEYVFNDMFKKLQSTFDQYRDQLPSTNNIQQAIAAGHSDDPFILTVHILDMLKAYAAESPAAAEIFENMRKDLWHGLDPIKVKRHLGKYYISSIPAKD